MAINNRIHFGVEAVGFAKEGLQSFVLAHGVQSCGITTTFNLDQVFELGQTEIYQNIEDLPEMEITIEKVLDGYAGCYALATNGSTSATLLGRSAKKTIFGMAVYSELQDSASGVQLSEVQCSGALISSLGWSFPITGNFSETVSLVGNNKVWSTGNTAFGIVGNFTNLDFPRAITGSGGVNRRQNLIQDHTTNTGLDENSCVTGTTACVFPREIEGISSSGTNELKPDGYYKSYIQNINVSANLGREPLFQQGRRTPYFRYVKLPVAVNSDFEVIASFWDTVSAAEVGIYNNGDNTRNQTIRLVTQEGTKLNLGTRNRLNSVVWSGGDTAGANVTLKYSYTGFNTLTYTHPNDPSAL